MAPSTSSSSSSSAAQTSVQVGQSTQFSPISPVSTSHTRSRRPSSPHTTDHQTGYRIHPRSFSARRHPRRLFHLCHRRRHILHSFSIWRQYRLCRQLVRSRQRQKTSLHVRPGPPSREHPTCALHFHRPPTPLPLSRRFQLHNSRVRPDQLWQDLYHDRH